MTQSDLALEIHRISDKIYKDSEDIEYYQNALDKKENITTTLGSITCRSTTFYPEDLKALIDSKQAQLDKELKYLKGIIESYEDKNNDI